MKKFFASILAFSVIGICFADDSIKLVGPKTVAPYKIIKVSLTGASPKAGVIWKWDKKAIDGGKIDATNRTLWLVAPPGQYTIEAIVVQLNADGSTAADDLTLDLTVGTDPGPAPTPVPTPSDPLTADLQVAYTADTSPTKAADKAALSAVYKAAGSILTDPNNLNLRDVFNALTAARKKVMPDASMVAERERIAQELSTALGTVATMPIDDDFRTKAKAVFAKIATALDGVK